MEKQEEREWFSGETGADGSFAAAAVLAVEKAEEILRGRGEVLPTEYDVRLQVLADNPLSGYRVLASPSG